jgi:hypothetical protein
LQQAHAKGRARRELRCMATSQWAGISGMSAMHTVFSGCTEMNRFGGTLRPEKT